MKLLTLIPLLAFRAAAQAPVEFNFAGTQCFHYDTPVPARSTLEICGALPKAEVVLWKFTAGADLPVSIRAEHAPSSLVSHAAARISGGQFIAPTDGRYCWSWKNTNGTEVPFAMEMEHP